MFVHDAFPEQVTVAPSCKMSESSPEAAEQLYGVGQLREMLEMGGVVGQPLHMQSWGLGWSGPSCKVHLIAEGGVDGHAPANGESMTKSCERPGRASNMPSGRLVSAEL